MGTLTALPVPSIHLVWFVPTFTILESEVSKPGFDTCILSPTAEYGCESDGCNYIQYHCQ